MTDEQVQNLNAMTSVLRKYAAKAKYANDTTSKRAMSAPSYSGNTFTPFIKKTLCNAVKNVGKQLKFDQRTAKVGDKAACKLVDYCDYVEKGTRNQLFNLTNTDGKDNTVTSLLKYNMAKCCKDYMKTRTTLRECGFCKEDIDTYTDDQLNSYIDSMEKVKPGSLDKKIADRVSTATQNFIDTRNEKNDEIKEVYRQVSSKIKKADNEQQVQQLESAMKKYKTKLLNKPLTIMEALVMNLAEFVVKNQEEVPQYFSENGKLKMDCVVEDAQAIYSVIETANMYGLINCTPELIEGYINSFKD